MVDKDEIAAVVNQDLNQVLSVYTRKELIGMTHEYHKEYILAADRKASILLTGLFGLLGLSANAVSGTDLNLSPRIMWMLALAAISGISAIVCSGLVIYPRLYKDKPEGFEIGYIYWERIKAHGDKDNFIDNLKSLNESPLDNNNSSETPIEELSKNLFNLAHIASNKYSWLRRAMVATQFMFYFGAIAVLLWKTNNPVVSGVIPTIILGIISFVALKEEPSSIIENIRN